MTAVLCWLCSPLVHWPGWTEFCVRLIGGGGSPSFVPSLPTCVMHCIGCLSLSGYNIVSLQWSPVGSFAAPPLTFATSAAQCRCPVILYPPIRLSGEMNKSIPPDRMNRYRVSPLKLHKTQNINAKHLQCQCIVSGCSCGPLPYIFEIYLFFFSGPAWKNWIRKLRTIALHVYFRVLNFNTTSNYQLCTFLNIVLCL